MFSKKILALFFLVLIMGIAQAQTYSIARHEIQMKVSLEGLAHVNEKFFLNIPNDLQLQKFREKSLELGVELDNWRKFNPQIHVYIGEGKNIKVSFNEENEKYLELEYDVAVPIMAKTGETARQIFFELNKLHFQEFNERPFWVIPNNTTITITFPVQTTIDPTVKPEALIAGNQLIWVGYKTSNALILKYSIEKQIAPSFDLTQFVQTMIASPIFATVAAIILVMALIAYIKRKAIAEKIENYIVKNSELEKEEETENE